MNLLKELWTDAVVILMIAVGFFGLFFIWQKAASAELTLEQIHYLYEDDRYFARLLWTPETQHDFNFKIEDLGTIKAEIGIWLN
tara:strand:- start:127 stop:378 length:252 start_codon:yes stop_codon:yes gene_type:complete